MYMSHGTCCLESHSGDPTWPPNGTAYGPQSGEPSTILLFIYLFQIIIYFILTHS